MTWVLGIGSALGVVLWLIEKLAHGHTKSDLKAARLAYEQQRDGRAEALDRCARLSSVIARNEAELERLRAAFVDVAPDGSIRDQLNRVPSSHSATRASGRLPAETSPGVVAGPLGRKPGV